VSGANYTFKTSAFADSAETRARNVNGLGGHDLAAWLRQEFVRAGCEVSDIWPEDHGWAFSVTASGAVHLCVTFVEMEEGPPFEGHVSVVRKRSLMDRLMGRNTFEREAPVSACVDRALRSHADITEVEMAMEG
jgi:hypothetical protein